MACFVLTFALRRKKLALMGEASGLKLRKIFGVFVEILLPALGLDQRMLPPVAYPGILFGEGVQQNQLRTEDRENGVLGAVGP